MSKVSGYYNIKINLEGEDNHCEPVIIERTIRENLNRLGYKFVRVDCVDFDINDIEE
jgi:hypothetical protein